MVAIMNEWNGCHKHIVILTQLSTWNYHFKKMLVSHGLHFSWNICLHLWRKNAIQRYFVENWNRKIIIRQLFVFKWHVIRCPPGYWNRILRANDSTVAVGALQLKSALFSNEKHTSSRYTFWWKIPYSYLSLITTLLLIPRKHNFKIF